MENTPAPSSLDPVSASSTIQRRNIRPILRVLRIDGTRNCYAKTDLLLQPLIDKTQEISIYSSFPGETSNETERRTSENQVSTAAASELISSLTESPKSSASSELKLVAKPLSDEMDSEHEEYHLSDHDDKAWMRGLSTITEERASQLPSMSASSALTPTSSGISQKSTAAIRTGVRYGRGELSSHGATDALATQSSKMASRAKLVSRPAAEGASTSVAESLKSSPEIESHEGIYTTGIKEFIRRMMLTSRPIHIETINRTKPNVTVDFVYIDKDGNINRVCTSSKSSANGESEVD